jgi:hypothetical protein
MGSLKANPEGVDRTRAHFGGCRHRNQVADVGSRTRSTIIAISSLQHSGDPCGRAKVSFGWPKSCARSWWPWNKGNDSPSDQSPAKERCWAPPLFSRTNAGERLTLARTYSRWERAVKQPVVAIYRPQRLDYGIATATPPSPGIIRPDASRFRFDHRPRLAKDKTSVTVGAGNV